MTVTLWNGALIELAIERAAVESGSSNPSAKWARALESHTVKSLTSTFPPDEDWVMLTYVVSSRRASVTRSFSTQRTET